MIELTQAQAKRLIINRQGLQKASAFGRGEKAMLDCIQRLGYIQIDTISVIQRAHHHTYWTRIPGYQPDQLELLQHQRKIFEYWSHAAAYLPMDDYRFCLPYMNAIASGQVHWRKPDKKLMKKVLKRIETEGELRARDFDAPKSKNANQWGGMKPAKIALEQLFIEGQLMISHRDGFQKVFDLPERVLPADLDTRTPETEEYCRYLIERTIHAQGIATESEMGYLRKGIKADLRKQVAQMVADEEIVPVQVRGNTNSYYSILEIVAQAKKARVANQVHLLSPFDNLVIQRKRGQQLFDYDYQIECYVPAKKRIHGYFCLPVLFGEDLVGRVDCKADRKTQLLAIRNLVIEKQIKQLDSFVDRLAIKLKAFAAFNHCDDIKIEKCNDKKVHSALSKIIL